MHDGKIKACISVIFFILKKELEGEAELGS